MAERVFEGGNGLFDSKHDPALSHHRERGAHFSADHCLFCDRFYPERRRKLDGRDFLAEGAIGPLDRTGATPMAGTTDGGGEPGCPPALFWFFAKLL